MEPAPSSPVPESPEWHAKRAVEGSQKSIDWVADHLSVPLHQVAQSEIQGVLANHYEPADVVGDAWARVYPKLPTIRGEHGYLLALQAYLRQTIRHRATELLEKALRNEYVQLGPSEPEGLGAAGWSQIPAEITSVFTKRARREDFRRFATAVKRLGEPDHTIVTKRLEGATFKEIGSLLDMKENSVNKRYERACAELRRLLPESLVAVL